jgi:hypothetical protein
MLQVRAMELDSLTPDLPTLLLELGINYDPDRLAAHLSKQWPKVGWVIGEAVVGLGVWGGEGRRMSKGGGGGRCRTQWCASAKQRYKVVGVCQRECLVGAGGGSAGEQGCAASAAAGCKTGT